MHDYANDRNASVTGARFFSCAERAGELQHLDPAIVYKRFWLNDEGRPDHDIKAAMQAEVLVRDRIDPCFIRGLSFRSEDDRSRLTALFKPALPSRIEATLFFGDQR